MKSWSKVLVCKCAGIIALAAFAAPGDLVFSEDFEQTLDGWKPFKKSAHNPWKIESGIGRPRGVAMPPTSCLVWERSAEDSPTYGLMRIVPVKPGQILKLTVSTLMESDPKGFTKGPNVAIGIGNAKKFSIWKATNRFAEHNLRDVHGWHTLELTLPAIPAEADRIQIVFEVDGKSVGRFRFDDLEIRVAEEKELDLFTCSRAGWTGAEGKVLFSSVVCIGSEKCPRKDLVLRLSAGAKSWPVALDSRNIAESVVDIAELPLGATPVRLTASAADGKELGSVERTFTREPVRPMGKRPKVHFDAHQRMVIDGEPIFPLGIYWHYRDNDDDEALKMLAASPFNFVVSYDKNLSREMMDRLAATGKKVFVNLSVAYKFPPEARTRPLKTIKSEADAEAFVREKVALLKNHPALLGWYIADELPQSMMPTLRARQVLLKRLDPEHVTGMCLIGANGLREFSDCADWMGMDCYPVGGLSASEEEKVHPNMQMFSAICERAQEQTKGLKPVWPVPQAFNWQADYPNETYPWMRFPNFAECRSQAWLNLAGGGNGFCYFMFHSIYRAWKKGDRQPYEDLIRSVEEVRKLGNIFLSTESAPQIAEVPTSLSVRSLSHRGARYVILCNKTWQSVAGQLVLPDAWDAASVEVGEKTVLKGGTTLAYDLPPIGVSVMRLIRKNDLIKAKKGKTKL